MFFGRLGFTESKTRILRFRACGFKNEKNHGLGFTAKKLYGLRAQKTVSLWFTAQEAAVFMDLDFIMHILDRPKTTFFNL